LDELNANLNNVCTFKRSRDHGLAAKLINIVASMSIRRRVLREPSLYGYTDMAITKLPQEAESEFELMHERPRLVAAQARHQSIIDLVATAVPTEAKT
jgi:hypothetical protein